MAASKVHYCFIPLYISWCSFMIILLQSRIPHQLLQIHLRNISIIIRIKYHKSKIFEACFVYVENIFKLREESLGVEAVLGCEGAGTVLRSNLRINRRINIFTKISRIDTCQELLQLLRKQFLIFIIFATYFSEMVK